MGFHCFLIFYLIRLYRWGPWNGVRFNGSREPNSNPVFSPAFDSNNEEIVYTYTVEDNTTIICAITSSLHSRVILFGYFEGRSNASVWIPRTHGQKQQNPWKIVPSPRYVHLNFQELTLREREKRASEKINWDVENIKRLILIGQIWIVLRLRTRFDRIRSIMRY